LILPQNFLKIKSNKTDTVPAKIPDKALEYQAIDLEYSSQRSPTEDPSIWAAMQLEVRLMPFSSDSSLDVVVGNAPEIGCCVSMGSLKVYEER